ncbi:helix-turn-helix domain-containing protein, partial [Bacillus subtilis]
MTLRGLRLRRGLSHKDVAQALGVHPSTVQRWENGSHRPRG